MGLRSYGIDLSDTAIKIAVDWARRVGMVDADQRIRCGDVRKLPWGDNYFDFAVSHGVLDSMPFEMARMACQELARVMVPGGLVYCDLISGDDTRHAREYTGEEVVVTEHEHGTVQSFFNFSKVKELVNDYFLIDECLLIRREDVVRGGHASRYHVVLRKK
jgi:ubiquinone/menaquinone biosynthesis C-methylase UbiE